MCTWYRATSQTYFQVPTVSLFRLPLFGLPLFGLPLFGLPLFGLPLFGLPLFGIRFALLLGLLLP